MKRIAQSFIFLMIFSITLFAQSEILTNSDIVEMTEAGLNPTLIADKIKTTGSNFDVTAKALIALKKAAVSDEVIALMVERSKTQPAVTVAVKTENGTQIIEKKNLTGAEILRTARTISIQKNSINPSQKALEKELLKRPAWKKLNLNIVENSEDTDLGLQISFVRLSLITHRYAWRIYDKRSGSVIAAGETTSWGSLAKNLAGDISNSLNKIN